MAMLPNDALGPVFLAAVEATEESIVNALIAARTVTGANDFTVHALPHLRLQEALRKQGRLLDVDEVALTGLGQGGRKSPLLQTANFERPQRVDH